MTQQLIVEACFVAAELEENLETIRASEAEAPAPPSPLDSLSPDTKAAMEAFRSFKDPA